MFKEKNTLGGVHFLGLFRIDQIRTDTKGDYKRKHLEQIIHGLKGLFIKKIYDENNL